MEKLTDGEISLKLKLEASAVRFATAPKNSSENPLNDKYIKLSDAIAIVEELQTERDAFESAADSYAEEIKRMKVDNNCWLNTCEWGIEDGNYYTECGECFYFVDGNWKNNGAKFCIYCGGKIIKKGSE